MIPSWVRGSELDEFFAQFDLFVRLLRKFDQGPLEGVRAENRMSCESVQSDWLP